MPTVGFGPLSAMPLPTAHLASCHHLPVIRPADGKYGRRPLKVVSTAGVVCSYHSNRPRPCQAAGSSDEGVMPEPGSVATNNGQPGGDHRSSSSLTSQLQNQSKRDHHWLSQSLRFAGMVAVSVMAGGALAKAARAQSRPPFTQQPEVSVSQWSSACRDSANIHSEAAEGLAGQHVTCHADEGAVNSVHHAGRSRRRAVPTGFDLASAESRKKDRSSVKKDLSPEKAAKRQAEKANYQLRQKMRKAAKAADVPAEVLRELAEPKKDKQVDPLKMLVADPQSIPVESSGETHLPGTAWRPDKLRDMTYTQFWWLVQQKQIDKVKYSWDVRSVWVTTKDTAPGGVRTEKVGLPFDPELYEHMLAHGVFVEDPSPSALGPFLAALFRFAGPLFAAHYLIQFSFRLGVKRQKDSLFGEARLEMVKNSNTTFADVAGVDQVKEEITEIVAFLRNPRKFLSMGARSPAGILLVGAPGTGKTLLAKAIAGESGVPFFSASGSEFMEIFVGVGASRIRDVFARARKAAPCILFIDEFDGLGKQRSASGGGDDESATTINQLLTEMDGFDDNTGVVVMAATNRPASLDNALTRPGRFDRVITMPLPNLEGRKEIFAVHARGKQLQEGVTFDRIARATAGFTGADIMNLMNQAAVLTVRQGRKEITEDDIFTALETLQAEKLGYSVDANQTDETLVSPQLRRSIAVYQAGCALLGAITPDYDEITKVVACPGGVATGHVYFVPSEEHLESGVTTRGFMESRMVVALAGRCAERLLLGDENVSNLGSSDLEIANNIAREMIFRCGFSSKMGPVSLMDQEEAFLGHDRTRAIGNVGTELARVAQSECEELLNGAEAKAYYGLSRNYDTLQALVTTLEEKETIKGEELYELVESTGAQPLESNLIDGFSFDEHSGELEFPGKPESKVSENGSGKLEAPDKGRPPVWADWHPVNPYTIRVDAPNLLSPELADI